MVASPTREEPWLGPDVDIDLPPQASETIGNLHPWLAMSLSAARERIDTLPTAAKQAAGAIAGVPCNDAFWPAARAELTRLVLILTVETSRPRALSVRAIAAVIVAAGLFRGAVMESQLEGRDLLDDPTVPLREFATLRDASKALEVLQPTIEAACDRAEGK